MKRKQNPLDELFIGEKKLAYLVDSTTWNKLLNVLRQHKEVTETLSEKVKVLEIAINDVGDRLGVLEGKTK